MLRNAPTDRHMDKRRKNLSCQDETSFRRFLSYISITQGCAEIFSRKSLHGTEELKNGGNRNAKHGNGNDSKLITSFHFSYICISIIVIITKLTLTNS